MIMAMMLLGTSNWLKVDRLPAVLLRSADGSLPLRRMWG